MLREERRRGQQESLDDDFVRSVVRDSKYNESELSIDEQYERLDHGGMERYEKKAIRDPSHKRDDRERQRAIAESERIISRLDRCTRCVGSQKWSGYQHLVICAGLKIYLSLPAEKRLCAGHCLLVPMDHVEAQRDLDEDAYEELCYFKKHLVKMFAKQGKGVVFFETVMRGSGHGAASGSHSTVTDTTGFFAGKGLGRNDWAGHTVIECVPVPLREFGEALLHFKKGLQDSDEEWSMNAKVLDLSQRGLMKTLPSSNVFSYFAVELELDPSLKESCVVGLNNSSKVARGANSGDINVGYDDGDDDEEDLDPMAAPRGVLSKEQEAQLAAAKAKTREMKAQQRLQEQEQQRSLSSSTQTPYRPGLAHIIEDRSLFPATFGHEVLCSMLNDEPFQLVVRQKRQPEREEKARVAEFKAMWKPFDWTRKLKVNQTGQPRF